MTKPDTGGRGEGRTEHDTALCEEIGQGWLHLNSSGQGLDALRSDPIVRSNAPSARSGCDTAHLSRYEGTDLLQWYGRKSDGRFHPFGKILRLTAAGRAALSAKDGR